MMFKYSCDAIVAHGFHFNTSTLSNPIEWIETRDTVPAQTSNAYLLALCHSKQNDYNHSHYNYSCSPNTLLCQVSTLSAGSVSLVAAVKPWAVAEPVSDSQLIVFNAGLSLSVLFTGGVWANNSILALNLTMHCHHSNAVSYPVVDYNSSTDHLMQLVWNTPVACGVKNGSIGVGRGGMSGAGLFFLMLFLTLFFYITIGCAYNIIVKRINRFPDFLPNYVFWESILSAARRNHYVRL